MHTVQLLLKTSKYERHEIDRRFHALAHLHNVCVKHARKCMIRLQHDKRYAELRQLYNELVKKEKMSKEEKSQKKKLAKQLAACRTVPVLYGKLLIGKAISSLPYRTGTVKSLFGTLYKSLWKAIFKTSFFSAGTGRSRSCMVRCREMSVWKWKRTSF